MLARARCPLPRSAAKSEDHKIDMEPLPLSLSRRYEGRTRPAGRPAPRPPPVRPYVANGMMDGAERVKREGGRNGLGSIVGIGSRASPVGALGKE